MQKKILFLALLFLLPITLLNQGPFSQESDEIKEISRLIIEGSSLLNQNRFSDAQEILELALEKSERISFKYGIGFSKLYLALIYKDSLPEKSYELAIQVLDLAQELENKTFEGSACMNLGYVSIFLGRCNDAVDYFHRALNVFKEINISTFDTNCYLGISQGELSCGNYEESLKYGNLALVEANKANDQISIKKALLLIGKVYIDLGSEDDAISAFERARESNREFKDEIFQANIDVQIARIQFNRGKYIEALSQWEYCYDIYRKYNNRMDAALCLFSMGNVHSLLGNFEKSKKTLEKACRIYEEIGSTVGMESIYHDLALVYIKLSEFSNADSLLEKSLLLCRERHDRRQEALILNTKASLSINLQDFKQAKKYINEALELNKEVKETDLEIAISFTLGNYYYAQGNFDESLEYYLRAKNVIETSVFDSSRPQIYYSLASTYLTLGDKLKALHYADKGLEINAKQGNKVEEVNLASMKGMISWEFGERENALANYERALDLSKQHGLKRQEGFCLNSIGHLYLWEKDYITSIKYLIQGLNIIKEIGDKFIEANIYERLAENYFYLHLYNPSLEYINKAVSLNLMMDKGSLQWEYYFKGRILNKLNKNKEALQAFKNADDIREFRKKQFQSENYLSYFLEQTSAVNEEIISILHNLSNEEEDLELEKEAFKYSEKTKARILLDLLGEARAGIKESVSEEIWKQINSTYAKIDSLRNQYAKTKDEKELNIIEENIIDAEEQLSEFRLQAKQISPKYSSIVFPETLTVDSVQKEIIKTEDLAILEYFTGLSTSFLFIITSNNFRLIPLNKGNSELAKSVNRLREPFEKIKKGSFLLSELEDFDIEICYNLYLELIAPAIPYLAQINKIIIIPHGCLNYLPFEILIRALPEQKDENVLFSNFRDLDFLIRNYSISYASSASVLDPKLQSRDSNKLRKGELLAFAKPKFVTTSKGKLDDSLEYLTMPISFRENINELLYSEREVEKISEYFEDFSVYKWEQATEDNFKKQCSYFPLIHISTHGFLNDSNPMYSSIVFAFNEEMRSVDLLHAYEIFNLNLDCDLVILSACETALGQDLEKIGGEGVTGLSKAFLYAGARSLVVSLWQVSDESTSILMSEFYKNLKEKRITKAEALRQAKLSLMKMEKKIGNRTLSYSHPFFWAPFILIGESE